VKCEDTNLDDVGHGKRTPQKWECNQCKEQYENMVKHCTLIAKK
jgi:hypothetical protein